MVVAADVLTYKEAMDKIHELQKQNAELEKRLKMSKIKEQELARELASLKEPPKTKVAKAEAIKLPMLTARELQVLVYLDKFFNERHYVPSVREICNGVGLRSTSSVHAHIVKLAEKGYIDKVDSQGRSISINQDMFQYVRKNHHAS